MAEGTTQSILLMSDISGYTNFVRQHTRSASHAREITVRLLKAIVSASSPPCEHTWSHGVIWSKWVDFVIHAAVALAARRGERPQ